MTKGVRTMSVDSKRIPKLFQALLRPRCKICKKKACLIAARYKLLCERCYEIINCEYKMTQGFVRQLPK